MVSSSPSATSRVATTNTALSSAKATSQLGAHEWFKPEASGNTAAPRAGGKTDAASNWQSWPQSISAGSSPKSNSSLSLSLSLSSSSSSSPPPPPKTAASSAATRRASSASRSARSHWTAGLSGAGAAPASGVVATYRMSGLGIFTAMPFICAAPHSAAKPKNVASPGAFPSPSNPARGVAAARATRASPCAATSASLSAGQATVSASRTPRVASGSRSSSVQM